MLVVVVGIGGYVYMKQAQSITAIGSNPQTTIDVTGVRNDLLALAKAERQHFASTGKYVTLDELRTSGDLSAMPARPNYSYSAEAAESSFKIIAVYSGPDPKAPKRLTVDDTMALTTE
jgi:hypothetical protein